MSILEQVEALLGSDPVVPELEAHVRYEVPSPTQVPEQVKDWAASSGYALSWQTYTTERLSQAHVQGIRPIVFHNDLDEETRASIPEHLLYLTEPDGLIQSGNAVLCVQPIAQREAHHAHIRERTNQLEGQTDQTRLAEDARRAGIHLTTPEWADTSRAGVIRGIR